MKCKKINPLIYLYKEGELTEPEKRKLHEHLATCNTCKQTVDEIGATDRFIKTIEPPVIKDPKELTDSIMDKIEGNEYKNQKTFLRWPVNPLQHFSSFSFLRMALNVAALFILGVFLYQQLIIQQKLDRMEQEVYNTHSREIQKLSFPENRLLKVFARKKLKQHNISYEELQQAYEKLKNENAILWEILQEKYPEINEQITEKTPPGKVIL